MACERGRASVGARVTSILNEAALREIITEIVRAEIAKATMPTEYLTTRAAAQLAKVAEETIRRWIREGKLEVFRAGRVVRVLRADLEGLMRGGSAREETGEEAIRRLGL